MRRSILPLVVLLCATGGGLPAGPPAQVERTLGQRWVDARAVEEVSWRHRLWPESNRGSKPALGVVLPDAVIAERVEDSLRKSEALGRFWDRPITAAQLQAEIDRMASRTNDPAVLREMFAALDGDPARVAEAIARPALADRLIRNWYAMDGRFHADARRRAEGEAARVRRVEDWPRTSGEYREIEYVRGTTASQDGRPDAARAVTLDPEEWDRLVVDLAAEDGAETGNLHEDAEGFYLRAVLSKGSGRIRVATLVWPKRPFEDWWKEVRTSVPATLPPLTGVFTLPVAPADCVNDTWRAMRTEMPYGRQGHTALWTGSEMIIWGGLGPSGPLKTGYRYQPATDTFTPTRSDDTAPMARCLHAAVWTGTEMIVWGGDSHLASPGWINTGGRYDPVTDTWRPTRADATTPAPRIAFAAAWTGSEMFVWGGGSESSNSYLATGGLYDPSADTWRSTGSGPGVPEARGGPTAVWTGSEIIVWGGVKRHPCCLNLHQDLDTGARYAPSTDSWVPISGGGARSQHTAIWTGGSMIVWGGRLRQVTSFTPPTESSTPLKTGSRYDPVSNTWTATRADATAPSARAGHTAVWSGIVMIVWGGFSNTGGRYDPSTDTWMSTRADASAPAARSANTAVWTGTEMIVWGGAGTGSLASTVNTGGRYDPISDSWVPTHSDLIFPTGAPQRPAVWTGREMLFGGPPTGRYDPAIDVWIPMAAPGPGVLTTTGTLVWTGTEMIACCDSQGGGGRYNPTTDSWATVTATGGPAGRMNHTAVWTGREMIVWGGITTPGTPVFLNTGMRYDPTADTWTATRVDVTTPAGRYLHTAVWTGSEMIVWGGYTEVPQAMVLNTGGRYDPTTDTWTATKQQAGKPEPRYVHAAIWSGTEMIVWGGMSDLSGAPISNSGWAYSPALDRWRQTGVDAATPSARWQQAQVWTGREMIVWGGTIHQTEALGSGGRYDPATDAWSPTLDDATTPSPRSDTAAVWTGREMLIWGAKGTGGNEAGPLNTGAGYCACVDPAAYWFRDSDGDGFGDDSTSTLTCVQPAGYVTTGGDCDDGNAGAWSAPGEARDLMFSDDSGLTWNPPAAPGAAVLNYDLLRSGNRNDFVGTASCVVTDSAGTSATDPDAPAVGAAFYYLVRAEDACPSGQGDLGERSDGTPRAGRSCP